MEWNSDLESVVLEVPQEGSKATTDSDRSTWRKLLLELESEAEVVDCTINSHDLKRETHDGGRALTHAIKDQRSKSGPGDDTFNISPKPKPCVFQWTNPASVNTCKWSSVASAFPVEASHKLTLLCFNIIQPCSVQSNVCKMCGILSRL